MLRIKEKTFSSVKARDRHLSVRSAMQFFHRALDILPLVLFMGTLMLASALPVADAKADPTAPQAEPRDTEDSDIDFSDSDGMSPLQPRRELLKICSLIHIVKLGPF